MLENLSYNIVSLSSIAPGIQLENSLLRQAPERCEPGQMNTLMKGKKYLIIAILVLLPWVLYSQSIGIEDRFDNLVFVVKGDLNKDKIPDSVVVLQDTLNEVSPYRLKIFLTKPDKKYFLSVQSDSAIDPKFPDGKDGYRNGVNFIDITIMSGILSINCELTRGHYEHKFRYQYGNFELIGYTEVSSNGHGVMYSTDLNLSTGELIEISERYDTDKLLSKKRKIIKIKSLPKLQNFTTLSTADLY